jgi:hypothetical protein
VRPYLEKTHHQKKAGGVETLSSNPSVEKKEQDSLQDWPTETGLYSFFFFGVTGV